jgi:putative ABC transport system substrate-binding protein
MMKRRDFVTLLAGTIATKPLAARAQQPERMRRIGVLMGIPQSDQEGQARAAAFRQGLQELKWVEDRNIHVDYRWGGGDSTLINNYAVELVGLKPDVILATNTPTVRALQQTTRSIPIVFAGLSDPIGDGFVASLSRPEGNITGFSSLDPPIAGKWMQLLKEVSPAIERIAVIFNPNTAPHSLYLPAMEAAAQSLGVKFERSIVRNEASIETAIAALGSSRDAGFIVMPDVFVFSHRRLIYTTAASHRVPAIYPFRYHAVDGGLMSYGSEIADQFHQAASYVDRILKGERPADLPVQAPTKFEFVINLRTAKELGLVIPPRVLALSDAVID